MLVNGATIVWWRNNTPFLETEKQLFRKLKVERQNLIIGAYGKSEGILVCCNCFVYIIVVGLEFYFLNKSFVCGLWLDIN